VAFLAVTFSMLQGQAQTQGSAQAKGPSPRLADGTINLGRPLGEKGTWNVTIRAMKLPGLGSWRRPQAELDENSRAAALEWIVDLHTFDPADLEKMASRAGAVQVSTGTDEFTAAMLGWPVRTFESTVPPGKLGWGWAKFAFGSWTTLSWVDENVWRHVVPKGWFYNVMVTGVKPS